MGVGENGEIANSSSPPAQSISFRAGKKAYLGEKVTLEKKGAGRYLHFGRQAQVSVRTVRKDGR